MSSIWPGNLESIDLPEGMTFTELWMIKEQIDAGVLRQLDEPERTFGAPDKWITLYGHETQTYSIITQGTPKNPNWCVVLKIVKLPQARAQQLLSGWPYV